MPWCWGPEKGEWKGEPHPSNALFLPAFSFFLFGFGCSFPAPPSHPQGWALPAGIYSLRWSSRASSHGDCFPGAARSAQPGRSMGAPPDPPHPAGSRGGRGGAGGAGTGKAAGGKETGKGKKIYAYIRRKKKKKSLQMARPGWARQASGGAGRGKRGPESSPADCKGGQWKYGWRGDGKDLSEMFRGFCLLAGASVSQPVPCRRHPGGAGHPLPPPLLALSLPGCFCSWSQDRHPEPGAAAGPEAGT